MKNRILKYLAFVLTVLFVAGACSPQEAALDTTRSISTLPATAAAGSMAGELGARGGNRTRTRSRETDFKSVASTSSATRAIAVHEIGG